MLVFITMSVSPILAQTQPFYFGSPHYYGKASDPKYMEPGVVAGSWWEGHKNWAGRITITNDVTNLYILIDTNDPNPTAYGLVESHVDIQALPENFPTTKRGNPKVGKFAYAVENHNGAQDYQYIIPLAELPQVDTLYIAVHAALTNGETAWANCGGPDAYFGSWLNPPRRGGNWATYFSYPLV